jgi:hypothetical protein
MSLLATVYKPRDFVHFFVNDLIDECGQVCGENDNNNNNNNNNNQVCGENDNNNNNNTNNQVCGENDVNLKFTLRQTCPSAKSPGTSARPPRVVGSSGQNLDRYLKSRPHLSRLRDLFSIDIRSFNNNNEFKDLTVDQVCLNNNNYNNYNDNNHYYYYCYY